MEFNVGQKVVCINDKQWMKYTPYPIVYGQIYVVQDIGYCTACQKQAIDIGFSNGSIMSICQCGGVSVHKKTKMWFFSSDRFIPFDEYEKSDKLINELIQSI